jgi:hypothetical protein
LPNNGSFLVFSFLARKGYLAEVIYILIEATLYWLEGYLALFTIAFVKKLPKEQIIIVKEIFYENKRYRTK